MAGGKSGWVQMLFRFFLVTLITGEPAEKDSEEASPQLPEDSGIDSLSKVKLPRKLPSIIEIKKKLPHHCFQSKTSTSMYYVSKDALLVIVIYYFGELFWNNLGSAALLGVTPLFWFIQGTMFTSLFVIGHDCGHEAFSNSHVVNDVVGTATHAFLMTPYYGWKITHKKHHKNTGNIDKDEVFYPVRQKDDTGAKLIPGFGLGIGWFAYIIKGYSPREIPHFNPFHPLYRKHVVGCLFSLAALVFWGSCLYTYAAAFGFAKLCFHYFGPLFVFASYVVVITFLHHHDDDIPWYSDHLWNNVRGQLSSTDRDFGFVHDIIHSISTHQIHHLFPKVPHYHLEEATQVFRKEFPELVHVNNSPIMSTYFKMFAHWAKQCVIPDDTDVHIYKYN